MRRLLLVMLVLGAGTVYVPAGARGPAALPKRVPGAITLEAAAGARWLGQQYQALAGLGDAAKDVLKRYDESTAAAGTGDYFEFDAVVVIGDLDGDGVGDLLRYEARFESTKLGPEGDTELTTYSGRTGARYWNRLIEDSALAFPVLFRVGNNQPGVVLIRPYNVSEDESAVRFLAFGGRRGERVYDKTVRTGDGKGSIQLGGPFDAYPRGGTDYLIGRARRIAALPVEGQALWDSEPYVLDGATGTIRQVHQTSTDLGGWVGYAAVGDVDNDKRDDLLRVRREFRDMGTVTALGVVEDEVHWERPDVPVGRFFWTDEPAQMTGSKGEDVLVNTWTFEQGLLEIPGVTDGLPLLDGPARGVHALLFDGGTGTLRFDRVDGRYGFHFVWDDVNRDGKTDVITVELLRGDKDGVRVTIVDGLGKVLLRRAIVVTPPPARTETGVGLGSAGDLDADGVLDLSYLVESASVVQRKVVHGFFLLGPNRLYATTDEPLNGTVDGRGHDRVRATAKDGTSRFTVADGWRGAAYWTLRVPTKANWVWLGPHEGARGRCDDLLLFGGALKGDEYWVDALDGRTGQVRWSRTFVGPRPPNTRPAASGRAATCR